jgi:hypothetical protein
MNANVRVTFDPPEDVIRTYKMQDVIKLDRTQTPPPAEVVQRRDAEVLLYCWDRHPFRRQPR